ncbi:MAG: hypothetical protein ACPG06_06400 [Alphaproteobacteria bacterium]
MRFLITLLFLPVLAVAAAIGLVLGERELGPRGQVAAIGAEISIEGRAYAPVEIVENVGAGTLLLEAPLEVTVPQIIRPDAVVLSDKTTGQSGWRVIEVTVPHTLPNAVLLVPLEGVATAADISLVTESTLNPGPLKDLGFGYFSADEMMRVATVAGIVLAALVVFWLPGFAGRILLRRKLRIAENEVEDERIRSSRAQKEAKAAASRADERITEIESHAAAREEEARTAIANAARLESKHGTAEEGGEARFWRDAVRDFLLAGNVARDDVERMLKAISERVKGTATTPETDETAEPALQPQADMAATETVKAESTPVAAPPLVATAPSDGVDDDDNGENDDSDDSDDDGAPKKGILGRRRRRR